MLTRLRRELFADPNGAAALIRRLFAEHGRPHWRGYALALGFTAVGAARTAARPISSATHQPSLYRSFEGVALVSLWR
jgi:hypothetical protein